MYDVTHHDRSDGFNSILSPAKCVLANFAFLLPGWSCMKVQVLASSLLCFIPELFKSRDFCPEKLVVSKKSTHQYIIFPPSSLQIHLPKLPPIKSAFNNLYALEYLLTSLETGQQLITCIYTFLPGNINTVLLRCINTMFSGPNIPCLSGDFFNIAFSSAQSHTPSKGPVGLRWNTAMLLVCGGTF